MGTGARAQERSVRCASIRHQQLMLILMLILMPIFQIKFVLHRYEIKKMCSIYVYMLLLINFVDYEDIARLRDLDII